MKLLITMIVSLAMVSCTSDEDNNSKMASRISVLKDALSRCEETTETLKAKLAFQEAGKKFQESSSTSYQEEQEEPTEPQCEDVNYNEIYVDGRLLDKCKADETKTEACGLDANECESGYAYTCLKNVKYKTIQIKKCE
jgi:hypothetical protein